MISVLVSKNVLRKIEIFYGVGVKSCDIQRSDFRDTSSVEKWFFSFINGNSVFIYIKKYRDDYYANYSEICMKEYDLAKKYKNSFHDIEFFSVVIPIFVLPEEGVVVSEEAAGLDLYTASLSKKDRFFSAYHLRDVYRLSGKGLRVFHEEFKRDFVFSLDEYKTYIDIRIDKLLELGEKYFNEEESRIISEFICSQGAEVDGFSIVGAELHGDYIPPNLIYSKGQIYLLDFLQCKRGAVIDELTYFFVFCNVQSIFLRSKYWASLAQEFLDGYNMDFSRSDIPQIRLFYLKHLLNYLLRTSYWFQGGGLGFVRKRYQRVRYSILKREILKMCTQKEFKSHIGGVFLKIEK